MDENKDDGNGLKPKKLSDKKMRRMEAKKRKVEAFLEVASANEEDRGAKRRRQISKADETTVDKKLQTTKEADKDSGTGPEDALSDELKMQRRQATILQKKRSMERPKLFLTLENLKRPIPGTEGEDTSPLYMLDLQHLLLYCIQGNLSSYKPGWCKLLRIGKLANVVVVFVKNASVFEYKNYANSVEFIFNTFDLNVEMIASSKVGRSYMSDLYRVPVSNAQYETMKNVLCFNKQMRSKKRDKKSAKDKAAVKGEPSAAGTSTLPNFSRLSLLLNVDQLIQERYPIPGSSDKVKSYVYSKDKYDPVTVTSPMFGLDCEMCLTIAHRQELTKISVVNEKMETIYSTFVKPRNRIINYLTKYSGVTKELLAPVTTRIEDVQRKLKQILPRDAILVGQSLNGDLHAVQLFHPYCIDTSIVYNLSGSHGFKTSLKKLAALFLGESIQEGLNGHDPTVDASAALKLVLLKLEKGPHFGDVITGGPAALEMEEENHSPSEVMDTSVDDGKDDNSESQSTEQTTPADPTTADNGQLSKEELSRRETFFQCRGLYDDMFRILAEMGKSVSVARVEAEADSDSKEEFKSDWMDVATVNCPDDRSVCNTTKDSVQEKNFACATFNSFDPGSEKENKEKSLRKIDKKIKKIYQSVPEKSLFCVLFTGRNGGAEDNTNAMAFMKIT